MPSATLTTLLGWITAGPTLTVDATGQLECRFTLAVSGVPILVAVSSAHARWLAMTVSAGVIAQVEGVLQSGAGGPALQAVMVDPVPHVAEGF
jgi:hypothetical protein